MALGAGGPDFYKKALVQLDAATLKSATMEKVLTTFKKVKDYTDKNAPGRDWNLATAMVINGQAGMQLMGDWAKGEFLAAGKVPGKDFVCVAAPGTAKAYTFNVDSFAMFKLKDGPNQQAQKDLAAAIMGPQFQEVFNLNKGSIPVRLNMPMDKFDDCAKTSTKDFVDTSKSGALLRPPMRDQLSSGVVTEQTPPRTTIASSLAPVSARVKKNMTAVSARFVCQSPSSIQNQ